MATVVSITNPITGAVEQVDKLDHTAQQIDDAVDLALQLSNPNLLDNWYFANPVNQRGQTEYSGAGYGIDRWYLYGGTALIKSNTIELKNYASGGMIEQRIDNPKAFAGKTLTLSVLGKQTGSSWYITIREDGVYSNKNLNIYGNLAISTLTFDVESTLSSELAICFACWDASDVAEISAIKLELGDQQTLAHQDADGNWVLNEIPDYGEQLLRCQRYLFVPTTQTDSIYNLAIGVGTSATSITFFLPLPTTMRAKSSITFSGLHAVNEINSMLAITKVANYGQVGNGVWLQATVESGAEVGKAYYLRTSNPWSLVLDANL